MYTQIIFVPADKKWIPCAALLAELLQHLGADRVDLECDSVPYSWDDEEEPAPVFKADDLSVDRAVELWAERQDAFTLISAGITPWSLRASQALEKGGHIEYYEQLLAAWLDIGIGPESIPDYDQEKTQAEFTFSISISGDGLPKDPGAFLEFARETEPVLELMQYLEAQTNMTWEVLVDLSY